LRRVVKIRIVQFLLVAIVFLLWQFLSNEGFLNPIIYSNPAAIASNLVVVFSGKGTVAGFYPNLYATLLALSLGYAIVVVVGVPLGIALGWIRTFGAVMEPLIIAFFSIPSIVLYPIIYLVFGLGVESKILFGALVGFFIVVSNAVAAAKHVKREYILLGDSLGFSRLQTLRKVILPMSAPYVMTGLRFGFSLTFIGVVAGEMIASTSGLGRLVENAVQLLNTTDFFTLIVIVLLIATLGNLLLSYVEKRMSRYKLA
jgi:NitT/TauT family transport system permease protein